MADTPLFDSAVETAPNDYELPAGPDRTLKSVLATFDGTGAAGSFYPAVQILSPSGAVVITAAATTSVAAGASADVSWFLRVGGVAAAAALEVTDGTHVVNNVTEVLFTAGATVSSGGAGIADVAITGYTSPLTTKGDIFGHSTVDARIPVGADNTVLTADSTQALGVKYAAVGSLSGGRPNVQVFGAGAGQTWTKPAGTTAVDITCIGAGGGGGGGGNGSTNTSGGGGGGGGAVARVVLQASDVPGTVTVNVGAGGNAGNAGTASGAGGNGGDGGSTTFGTLLTAGNGGGGLGGATGTVTRGGSGGGTATGAVGVTVGTPGVGAGSPSSPGIGGQGASSSTGHTNSGSAEWGGAGGGGDGVSVTGVAGASSIYGGAGGGGGGSGSSNPGAGGATQAYSTGGGAAAGVSSSSVDGTVGSPGTFTGPYCGDGGGGGGATSAASHNGAAGGQGGIGSGGGGGGSSTNATPGNSGAGGKGGDGRVIVISW